MKIITQFAFCSKRDNYIQSALFHNLEKDIEKNQIQFLDKIRNGGIVHSEICQTVLSVPAKSAPLPIDQKVIEEISVLEEAVGNPTGTTLMSSSNETGTLY